MMAVVAAMLVVKNNLRQIYYRLRYPLWAVTLMDIIRWREHPALTFIALNFHSYTFLVAEPWQYPIILGLFVAFIGFASSRHRTFNSVYLYRPEIEIDTSTSVDDNSSLREKYNKLKNAAHSVADLVESMRINIERVGNIFTWADPLLTVATLSLMLAFCFAFSAALYM